MLVYIHCVGLACRLGVQSAALHDIYSPAVTQALKSALLQFDKKLPGFVSDAGLLHGVETRTSSPVSGCPLAFKVMMLMRAYAVKCLEMLAGRNWHVLV